MKNSRIRKIRFLFNHSTSLWYCILTLTLTGSELFGQKYEPYNSETILNVMTDYLNNALPKKANGNSRFSNSSVQPKGYFIFDLTDTTNATIKSSGHIDFREGHVYHFCPFRIWNSVSHIMILHKGELKVFRALNCDNKGDTVDEVLDYLKADYSNQKELLLRVENYRSYGLYRKRHGNNSFNCEIYIEN